MRAFVLAAALAVVTLGLVIFIFVDLHEAKTPPPLAVDHRPAEIAQPLTPTPPPIAPTTPPQPIAAQPQPQPIARPPVKLPVDPLDQVIQGKTRREWRATYAAKQKRTLSEMEQHQAIIDRAVNGEEPDPIQLSEAHTRMRELQDELRHEQEELQRIEATDPDP